MKSSFSRPRITLFARSFSPTSGASLMCSLSRLTDVIRWTSDLLREKITPRTKVVFFCNPHNPGGTVWRADEIQSAGIVVRGPRPDPYF